MDGNDIVASGYIYENDFKFDKFPTVAKFIQDYVNGKRIDELFTAPIYQLEVAENHNYFVGNLGILVGDITISSLQ